MTGSEPSNMDRFPFSFFFLFSHIVVLSLSLSTASVLANGSEPIFVRHIIL
jgi:hypothetical protein